MTAACLLAACGSPDTPPDTGRRTWRGPTDTVSSKGITTYDRREIAQRVAFPVCLAVGQITFRFGSVRPVPTSQPIPSGLFDTGYSLDRWRLLSAAGALDEQPTLFVTTLGSTGIVAEYPRLPVGNTC